MTPVRDIRCAALRKDSWRKDGSRVDRAADEIYRYRNALRDAGPLSEGPAGVTWSWSARRRPAVRALVIVLFTVALGLVVPQIAVLP